MTNALSEFKNLLKIKPPSITRKADSPVKRKEESPKRKEEAEKAYKLETEPDLRKDDRGEEYLQESDDCKTPSGYGIKAAPLTERVSSDKPSESIDDFELLASPKESDNLINHSNGKGFFEKNGNNKSKKKPFVPPLAKDTEAFNKLTRAGEDIVVVENKMIDGQKVEDVRMLTGMGNLNSPLGRQVKIEFNGHNNENQIAVGI